MLRRNITRKFSWFMHLPQRSKYDSGMARKAPPGLAKISGSG